MIGFCQNYQSPAYAGPTPQKNIAHEYLKFLKFAKATCTDPISSAFIFLNLLKTNSQQIGKFLLSHVSWRRRRRTFFPTWTST